MNLSFIGNLAKDPELKYSPSGGPYCFFSAAMNTHKKGDPKNKTIWWNCVAFGDTAEMICTTFKKGKPISVLESNIEITVDKRDSSEKMQVKVWKASKPVFDEKKAGTAEPGQEPEGHGIKEGDCPF